MNSTVDIDGIKLIPYSNKDGQIESFIVSGIETKSYTKELKLLDGRWAPYVRNPESNSLGYWVFNLERLDAVSQWAKSLDKTSIMEIPLVRPLYDKSEFISDEDHKYLLLPILYKIPHSGQLGKYILDIKDEVLINIRKQSLKYLFRESLLALNSNNYKVEDLVLLYKCLYKFWDLSPDHALFRISAKQIKYYLKNPLHYFLYSLKISFYEEQLEFGNKKYEQVFLDVVRDNIIKEAEKEYLTEQAHYYGVDLSLVEKAINSYHKFNSSFYFLIKEVCEDGVLTSNEEEFIYQQAREYSINQDTVFDLLDTRLKFVKKINDFKTDKEFRKVVLAYFLLYLLDTDSVKLKISPQDLITDYFEEIHESIKSEIDAILVRRHKFEATNLSVEQIYELLGFSEIGDFENSIDKSLHISSFEKENHIFYKGYHFFLEPEKSSNGKLFTYETAGSDVFVKINPDHEFIKGEEISEGFFYLLVCLISSRMEMFSEPSIDQFFDLLELNQRHLNRELKSKG